MFTDLAPLLQISQLERAFSTATPVAYVNNAMNYKQGGSPMASVKIVISSSGEVHDLKCLNDLMLCCVIPSCTPPQFKNMPGNTVYFTCYTAM